MSEPIIKTGIYKHFRKGDLYFVSGTVLNAETDENLVICHALYKESIAFVKSLFNFREPLCPNAEQAISILDDYEVKIVRKFELIKELPVEKAKYFIPSNVVFVRSGANAFMRIKINKVFMEGDRVIISYSYVCRLDKETKITLEEYLKIFSL